ncbi:SAM-dependent methyltransferase [Pseudomonas brassicacearum]|uniref:SAM-dependent methyltransferase n=1 Tax=Pseudomonas brassicacearum TaxID=930166 RepID=A0AAW8M3T6_9PSED|nr:class I SAM-dependent methyltransferase [Pseudomonas brassicacearum]MDR6956360.1 SAM-dependent methyltransferase [Pseudomonas brassicacearum]
MARIYTKPEDKKPKIDKSLVLDFFEKRASKVNDLGPTRAVIYQDKDADLAERRDIAEKTLLLPLLEIDESSRILDAGCGTGRWAEAIIPKCGVYVGVDVSPGLIKVATERFGTSLNAKFEVCPVDLLTRERIGIDQAFTHILSFGVFIYLNDDEIIEALHAYASLTESGSKIMFREPIAVENRLTLIEHFSNDMEQTYNAIYRTEEELITLITSALGESFFQQKKGDVYPDGTLNNRTETKQKWYLWESL